MFYSAILILKCIHTVHPGVQCNFLQLLAPGFSCTAFVYQKQQHKTAVSSGSYFMLLSSYKTRDKKRKCVRMIFFYCYV